MGVTESPPQRPVLDDGVCLTKRWGPWHFHIFDIKVAHGRSPAINLPARTAHHRPGEPHCAAGAHAVRKAVLRARTGHEDSGAAAPAPAAAAAAAAPAAAGETGLGGPPGADAHRRLLDQHRHTGEPAAGWGVNPRR